MKTLLTFLIWMIAIPCFAVNTRTYTVCEGGGCDYTTVQAAETALEQDLVANDSALTIEIQNTWVSAETGGVLIFGWTTDATRFLTITATGSARAGAKWSTTAYRTVHVTNPILVGESFTVIDGLQANLTTTDATANKCITTSGIVTGMVITNCFVKGSTGSAIDGVDFGSSGSSGNILRNTVIIDFAAQGVDVSSVNNGTLIQNNSIENCGVGIHTGNIDGSVVNCIFINCTTPITSFATPTPIHEENYSDGTIVYGGTCTGCGAGDQNTQADPYEDISTEDYSLASGAAAIDVGKDLSGQFTDAIGGKTRDANFDKGADEFIAAAPAGGNRVLIRIGMMFWHYGIEI